MTRRIESARKHGPFDLRWLTARPVREFAQPDQGRPTAITWAAAQAWEGEGGALLPEERPTNRKTRERRSADAAGSAARTCVRVLSLLPRDRDSREPERTVPDNLRVCSRHGPQKSKRTSQIQIFKVREGGL